MWCPSPTHRMTRSVSSLGRTRGRAPRDADLSAGGKGTESAMEGRNERPLLVADVGIDDDAGDNDAQLVLQWRQGNDEQAFESFVSHVRRKIREAAEGLRLDCLRIS